MLRVIAENEKGQSLDFSASQNHVVTSVTGVMPPKANVNTAALATKDGSVFNSSRLTNRNVVLTILPVGSVETARIAIYSIFKAKKWVKLHFRTAGRSVWIDGHVESVSGDLFAMTEKVQVSVICSDPWLKAETPVTETFDDTTHQATVDNPSDDEVGFVCEFTASGSVQNVTLTDSTTGESFTLNFTFQSGDKVTLNTKRGEKSVTLTRSGTTTNLINSVAVSSKWLQLAIGENELAYACTSGVANLSAQLTMQPIFEGV